MWLYLGVKQFFKLWYQPFVPFCYIAATSGLGLPVSTTHVLSGGVAGAMAASGGTENLNKSTIKNIVFTWVLTLPAAILPAYLLFTLLHLLV